jgi:ribosomal protein L33
MARKPTKQQQEAFAFHEELSSSEMYWEDGDETEAPTHYMLDAEFYFKLSSWLRLLAGRAYPKRRYPSHPSNKRKHSNRLRLEKYEALCREFAANGDKAPASKALEAMSNNEKQQAALEKALYRERKRREQSRALIREALS